MNRSKRYSPEVRERAVRLVFDSQKEDQSQWAAIQSIADKIGCTHETLRRWDRQQEQDQGLRAGLSSQYLSIRHTERLAEVGIESSVGSVGDSYDNALAESIIGLYKTEVIWPRGPWKNIEDVEYATLEWVDWFNNKRLLEPIGNIPPAELEKAYYEQLESQPKAA